MSPLGPAYGDGFAGIQNNATSFDGDNVLYIVGDDITDGSIRLSLHPGDSTSHLEKRADGVWNDTGIRISPSSLLLGRDMVLSSASSFLETLNPSEAHGHDRSLIPHILFDVVEGTDRAHTPFLDKRTDFVIFDTAVGETSGTAIGQLFTFTDTLILNTSTHEVGTTGATDPVTLSYYEGTDNTGFLFFQKIVPASELVAETSFVFDFDSDFGLNAGDDIFLELTSDTSFSMKTDVSGNLLTTYSAQELVVTDMILDELVLTENLDLVFTNDGSFVTVNQFPAQVA